MSSSAGSIRPTFESPFLHHIHANTVPSSGEVPQIKEVIRDNEGELATLSIEIADLGKTIAELGKRMDELLSKEAWHKGMVERHSSLLAPIRTLPPDILLCIFLLAKDTHVESLRRSPRAHRFKKPQRYPVIILSHVCHHWRTLTIMTPLLWTTLSIHLLPEFPRSPLPPQLNEDVPKYHRKMARITDMAATFALRVADCPISLSLSASDPYPFEEPEFNKAVTPLVNALRSAAWQSASFELSLECHKSPLLRLLPIPDKSLNTIRELKVHQLDLPRNVMLIVEPRAASPEYLSSLDVEIPWKGLSEMHFKWDILTDLAIGSVQSCRLGASSTGLSPEEALDIMRRSINLVNLQVRLNSVPSPPSRPLAVGRTVTLPRLRSLSIRDIPAPKSFASALILPSLRRISVLYDHTSSTTPEQESDSALEHLISRYGAELMDVSFSYGHLATSALVRCLEGLSNVESLHMVPAIFSKKGNLQHTLRYRGSSRLDRALVKRLTPTKSSAETSNAVDPCLCPKLKSLTCKFGSYERNVEDWIEFIKARRAFPRGKGPVSWLERVSLDFVCPSEMNFSQKICELRDAGISLRGVTINGDTY